LKAEEFKRNFPFDIPKNPSNLELMLGWFFDQIRMIVGVENHKWKFDGGCQVLDILHEAAFAEGVNIAFSWDKDTGIWYIEDPKEGKITKKDILNLPLVAYRFSKIYRHHANEYTHPEDKSKRQIRAISELIKEGKNGRKKG
jgi:hypothetical protein